MSGRDQSDAIWIRQQEQAVGNKQRHHSVDFSQHQQSAFQSRFGFGRSMSVNSEGASTNASSSPPYSPIDNMASGNKNSSGPLNIPPSGGGRFRTSSFSAGYGPSGHDRYSSSNNKSNHQDGSYQDPYLMHSPLSISAPGRESLFRRSNSISVGALEHSHDKYDNNNRTTAGKGNLGPIDEVGKMYHFGDALKRSMGQLFSAPKLAVSPPKAREAPIAAKKNAMQDRVVSMLCDGAMR